MKNTAATHDGKRVSQSSCEISNTALKNNEFEAMLKKIDLLELSPLSIV